jgi:hypothetical protein
MAISEKLSVPTVLVVDEFPTVESKVVKDILAETRKFNLYMYASAQYLGQLSKPVLDSLISNTKNVISFRVTKEDARLLSSMMEIKVEEFFKKHMSPSELEESKREMFVKLHTQECIVRLFDGEKYLLPMKVKTVDQLKWGAVAPGRVVPMRSYDEPDAPSSPAKPPASAQAAPRAMPQDAFSQFSQMNMATSQSLAPEPAGAIEDAPQQTLQRENYFSKKGLLSETQRKAAPGRKNSGKERKVLIRKKDR